MRGVGAPGSLERRGDRGVHDGVWLPFQYLAGRVDSPLHLGAGIAGVTAILPVNNVT